MTISHNTENYDPSKFLVWSLRLSVAAYAVALLTFFAVGLFHGPS